ncbi:hypothetical protein [Bdellovibrio sp. HCB2-146]|uniref:hypothetical protein n=1 Tax=Bdellovibrio sp. HCB2-146 TaxID=3394362 RepID=UPI0039BC5EB4
MLKTILLSLFIVVPALSAIPQDLVGTWVQPCKQKAVRTEVFSEETASLTEVYYLDNNCSQPLIAFQNDGEVVASAGEMDFRFTRVAMTLFHSDFVDDYNARAVCGFTDWQLGVEKEITALPCALFTAKPTQTPRAGDMRYGIYMIQANRLYFGKMTMQRNALSPEKRPNEFDIRFYVRQ